MRKDDFLDMKIQIFQIIFQLMLKTSPSQFPPNPLFSPTFCIPERVPATNPNPERSSGILICGSSH